MTAAPAPLHPPALASPTGGKAQRFSVQDLFRQAREIEIDHDGKIYKLRLTQANKLILTA